MPKIQPPHLPEEYHQKQSETKVRADYNELSNEIPTNHPAENIQNRMQNHSMCAEELKMPESTEKEVVFGEELRPSLNNEESSCEQTATSWKNVDENLEPFEHDQIVDKEQEFHRVSIHSEPFSEPEELDQDEIKFGENEHQEEQESVNEQQQYGRENQDLLSQSVDHKTENLTRVTNNNEKKGSTNSIYDQAGEQCELIDISKASAEKEEVGLQHVSSTTFEAKNSVDGTFQEDVINSANLESDFVSLKETAHHIENQQERHLEANCCMEALTQNEVACQSEEKMHKEDRNKQELSVQNIMAGFTQQPDVSPCSEGQPNEDMKQNPQHESKNIAAAQLDIVSEQESSDLLESDVEIIEKTDLAILQDQSNAVNPTGSQFVVW